MSKEIDGELTNQRLAFIDNYMIHFNATRAAKEAGFSSPARYSYQLLRHPIIKAEIEKRMEAYSEQRLGLKERVVEELINVALSTLDDIGRIKPDGFELRGNIADSAKRAVSEFSVTENIKTGSVMTRIKMHNKTQALDLLAKHVGLYKEQSVSINVKPYIIRRRNGEEVELGVDSQVTEDE